MLFVKRCPRKLIALSVLAVLCCGCQTIPKEVVELSYAMGQDLDSLNTSYTSLIHQYYESLREQRRVYLDDVWYPRYISNWRDDGELIAIASEEKIWSVEKNALVSVPRGSAPEESLKTLEDWVVAALYEYEIKESALLGPLNDDEAQLMALVNQSFRNITRANASITAHLNSLREVQEVQDDALKAMNLEELRGKINKQLIKASEKAKTGLEQIKKADARAENIARKIKSN